MTSRAPQKIASKADLPNDEAMTEIEQAPPAETAEAAPTPRRRGRPRKGKAVGREIPRDEELLKIAAEVLYKKGFDRARLDALLELADLGIKANIERQRGVVGKILKY